MQRVFAVDERHWLKSYVDTVRMEDEEDEDEDEDEDDLWEEEELDDLSIQVHPKSQLAISCEDEAVHVYYQDPNGSLGAIQETAEGWKIINLPATTALAGTPLATFNAEETTYLVYVSTDNTVRYMEKGDGEWKGQYSLFSFGSWIGDSYTD